MYISLTLFLASFYIFSIGFMENFDLLDLLSVLATLTPGGGIAMQRLNYVIAVIFINLIVFPIFQL